MGIDTYIKMETLPFDGISHIDMHMKLLDEETLLVAQYPEGMSDGPQIEENLEYILNNFATKWGTPFNVIRIPSPPSSSGWYPGEQDFNQVDGYYRTYTNSVFVNKTVLVPFYREEYDTIAQRIYEEALPGYNIVGIDCDDSGNNIISLSGAIHCITHSVGVNDPLLISYMKITDNCPAEPYIPISSFVKHKSGINNVFFKYRYAGDTEFNSMEMQEQADDIWSLIMTFDELTEIEYYIHAIANNGKEQYRPITALEGGYNIFTYGGGDCVEDVFGCTDPEACNYDSSILPGGFDDGSCIYPDLYYNCLGECLNDGDNDEVCDEIDNCPQYYNPFQEDYDGDNIGDACDGVDITELDSNRRRIMVVDVLGRQININQQYSVLIYIYDDGVIEKVIVN